MSIETKYEIGSVLWTIDSNRVTYFKVTGISVNADRVDDKHAAFTIKYKGDNVDFHAEADCFASKDELINSLK